MDEEFESFVVTNPDLVDEGIDVSGLKTTTDASILGNIPDGPGIQYEAYNPNRLSDLIRFYSGGFPMLDVPQAVAPVTTTPDTGGGGGMDQATGGLDLGGNTDFEQSLLDQGIGVQGAIGDPVVAPGEIPYTQEQMDAENAIPVTPQTFADTGRQNLLDQAGNVEDIGYATDYFPEYDFGPQPGISNPRAPGQNTVTQDTTAMDTTPSAPPSLGFENAYEEPMTQQDLIDSDANVGFVDAFSSGSVNEVTDDPTMQETISNAFTSARQGIGELATAGVDQIQEVGQSIANTIGGIYNGEDQTISILGKEINVPATLAGIALNQVVNAPISLAFSALRAIGGMLPEGGRSDMSDALGEQYGMDDIGRLTGGPMAGYAVDSAFGKGIEQSTADVKNDVGNTLSGKYGFTQSELDQIAEGTYTGTKGYNEIMGTTTNLVDRYKDLSDMEKQIQRNKTAIDYDMEGTDEGDRAAEEAAAAQAEADRIEAERRELQEINAAAAREQAAAEQRARDETDARMAAEAASRAAAAAAANRDRGRGDGGGGGQNTGGARGGGTSATSSGLGDLGFSDIRLKDNVELIGKSPSNINIYKFNYKGDSAVYEGVIANEVPWASVKTSNGYLMVDYNKIDVEFKPYAK